MANRIGAGSLVCFAKRKVPGQGIVLQRVRDINEYTGFDLTHAWRMLHDREYPEYRFSEDLNSNSNFLHDYMTRMNAIRGWENEIYSRIKDINPNVSKEILQAFWDWNNCWSKRYGGPCLSPKVDFCHVRWLKAPSDFGSVPAWGYKGNALWVHSKSLKNV